MNSGNPVFSYFEDPVPVSIAITSDVKINVPTEIITLPGIVLSSGWTTSNGYNWSAQGYTTDAATRGDFPVTVGGLTTAAGTAIGSFAGEYRISGFDERPMTISTPFSDTLDTTGLVDIDYAAGVTVKDITF